MSFQSSRDATPSTSPMSIASRSSSMSISSTSSSSPRLTPSTYQPFGSSMRRPSNERPSAYVSDDDLLGTDDAPFMTGPPPPPRTAEQWLARPLLPTAPRTSRTSSSPMKPIKP